jgi:6-phosphofructokinase 1
LNAAVRAFFHAARALGIEVLVSRYGFEGLLGRETVSPLTLDDVRGILPRGGTILGCSTRSNPFAMPVGATGVRDDTAHVVARIRELGIDALVLVGGDGTMTIGAWLGELGVSCVGIPKTIDGDVGGTESTCGVDTAVETATRAIDALHSTAEAHQRVMVVEVMGRYAGFIALRAAIAGGADAALLPEIPYDVGRVLAKIREREALGRRFSIVVVGEGARPSGSDLSEVEPGRPGRLPRLGGAGEVLARALRERDINHDVRVTVLGHLQRGGTPTAADRVLASRYGAHAAELCAERRFGRMVALNAGAVGSIPIADAARGARVDPRGELARCARALGIELGA